ncbi:MAG: protease complex subunit PrcB family protein [Gemmatimonadetes bacterium]|nr:protease complex subunit PrcB family protein [Gemmatimonadota bacterium]
MRTHRLVTALILSLAPAAACKQGSLPLASVPPGAQALSFTRLGTWYYSGIREARRVVITDRAPWQAAWAELHSPFTPQPPLPPVDFGEETVVLVAMGERSSGGYGIEITGVAADPAGRYIEVLEMAPGMGCAVTLALTQPVDAVVMPAAPAASVRFVERRETRDCR